MCIFVSPLCHGWCCVLQRDVKWSVIEGHGLNLLIHSRVENWEFLILLFFFHLMAEIFLHKVTLPPQLFECPEGATDIGKAEWMLTFLPFTIFVKSLLSWLSSIIQRGQIKCYVCFFFFKKWLLELFLIHGFQYLVDFHPLQLMFLQMVKLSHFRPRGASWGWPLSSLATTQVALDGLIIL